MNCWEILEITETGEEERIHEAYRRKLPGFHPEENPEGFRQLRRAYEEALARAAQIQASRETKEGKAKEVAMLDNREIREFLKEAEKLYFDYAKRIQPGEWEKILDCPVCQDLETQREAGWALLNFLMDHCYLPQACFAVMDKTFSWSDTGEELKCHFPEDFVENFLEKLEEEDSFRFALMPLDADLDYDAFFRAYYALRRAIWERKKEDAEKLLETFDGLGVEHPDVTVLRIRHLWLSGRAGEAWEQAKRLKEMDGDSLSSAYWYLRIGMDVEDSGVAPKEMEEGIVRLIEHDAESPGYWQLLGDFLCGQNRLEEGLKALRQAYRASGQEWDYLQDRMAEVAETLSRQMEAEGKGGWEFADLCWTARRYDKVREVLEDIEPPKERELARLVMLAGSCHELEDYEGAWKYRKAIWDSFEEDARVEALYMDFARDCGLSGRIKEALELYRQAEEKFGESAETAYLQAKLLAETEQRQEALRLCEKALKLGFHLDAFKLRTELLFEQKEYALIKEETGNLLRQGIQSAQVLFDYAKALRNLEEYEEAEKALKKLDELTGGSDIVWQEMAALYYDMDNAQEALYWIDRAIAQRDNLWRQYMRADYLRDLERYEEEFAVYEKLMKAGQNQNFVRLRAGRALENLHRFAEAEEYFQRLVDEDETYGAAWDGLGDVLQKQKRWEEAAEAYERGAGCNHLQAARDICRLYKRLHQDEKAEERVKAMLEKWPTDRSLLIICSDILTRRQKYEEALRCLNRYIELHPAKTAYGYREIAECYEHAKDYDKAREYYQKSIDTDPGEARGWRLMGKFLANVIKDQEAALPFLQKAIELNGESTYGYMKLGEVYEALGNAEEAKNCYEQSLKNYQKELEKDPFGCCSHEGMADVLLHLGRFEEAQEMIKKAMALESCVFNCSAPFCYEAVEDLAKIEERKGNLEKALEWMQQAGTYGTTDYYPKEIARLREALENSQKSAKNQEKRG